jgi:hypothetical protein
MFCSISITSSVQPQEIVIRMGTDMKTNPQLNSQSLLPAERLAVAACMGSLLTAIGNLLQEHPDLRAELSPNTGQTLVTIGEKLSKAINPVSA